MGSGRESRSVSRRHRHHGSQEPRCRGLPGRMGGVQGFWGGRRGILGNAGFRALVAKPERYGDVSPWSGT